MSRATTSAASWPAVPQMDSEDGQALLQYVNTVFDNMDRRQSTQAEVFNSGVEWGNPDNGDGSPLIQNMSGQWVTAQITSAAQLGTAITFTHNLDVQVTDNRPNVRWPVVNWLYGDLTGANPAPTIPGSSPSFDLLWVQGQSVTANSIDLVVYSSLTPLSAEPLQLDVWFVRAVR